MGIYQLVYVCNATDGVGYNDIDDILKSARTYNPSQEITGILLYRGGIFLQLLEGEKDKVNILFQKIKADKRSSNEIILIEKETNSRIYNDWSMGYRELTELDINMVNEILSWTKLINAAKDIDQHLILHIIERFKSPDNRNKKAQ